MAARAGFMKFPWRDGWIPVGIAVFNAAIAAAPAAAAADLVPRAGAERLGERDEELLRRRLCFLCFFFFFLLFFFFLRSGLELWDNEADLLRLRRLSRLRLRFLRRDRERDRRRDLDLRRDLDRDGERE